MICLTRIRKFVLLVFTITSFQVVCMAQRDGEIERLRMENLYLRQKNDSLRQALNFFEREKVIDPWDSLTGIGDDAGIDDSSYSGFGMSSNAQNLSFQKEVMLQGERLCLRFLSVISLTSLFFRILFDVMVFLSS